MQNNNAYNLQLAKTLFENTYAARVLNDNKDVIGKLRIVPCLPLDRSLLPADAPPGKPVSSGYCRRRRYQQRQPYRL